MPRIPESELDRIKSEIDLAALVRAKGVELKPQGADLVGRCPFHDDKTPSLVVTPQKGLWHCLGACQKGGSVIDWVMKAEGVSFRHAVAVLQEGKAATLLSSDKIVQQSRARRLPSPLGLDADDQALLNQVTAYYHETLKASPAALEYLKRRGIDHPEALSTFKLGYADRTLGLRLPEKTRKAGEAIRERLQKLGVYRESGHEHLSGSIIVPVLDAHGNTLNLYGRKILDNLRTGTAYHLYLPGPHRGVWNPAALSQDEVILCESLIDALSFWVHGFRNVTTAYGVEGFTEPMLSALLKGGVRRVFIAYDRDEAGDRAAEKLGATLIAEGLEVLRVQFPRGMDANEYIRKAPPAEKSLRVLLHAAEWMGKGPRPEGERLHEEAISLPSGERVDVETGEVLPAAASPASLPLAAPSAAAEASTLPAPVPAAEGLGVPCEVRGEDVHITLGDRGYRVRGLYKNTSFDVLKVNVRASLGSRHFIDSLDLFHAKAREAFVSHAALELEVKADILKRDLGRVLLKLEELQEAHITKALEPKDALPVLSEPEREEVLAYLRAPDLWARVCADLHSCGYVGEDVNKQVGYLAALSRRLPDPLSLLIQSSSAAGKSSLMDAILSFVPSEERVSFSAMTGQALFYMEGDSLKHKCLAIAEDGGMERAAYALKLLITEKHLSIASTGKDEKSGKHMTQVYAVEGPTAVFYSSTNPEVDPELRNRCITLTVDEERKQTRAIHEAQRRARTLDGRREAVERRRCQELHHNMQRLLRPVSVLNPYAGRLTFLDTVHGLRRDQMKYLTLIDAVAYLHQYQRPRHQDSLLGEYVEVTLEDIAIANALSHEVLGRSLDELAPQTRRLLGLVRSFVEGECKKRAIAQEDFRFTRWDIRMHTGWGNTQLKLHLSRLQDLEYLCAHRGRRGVSFEYELLYHGGGEDGERFTLGLLDVGTLRGHAYDGDKSGVNGEKSGSSRPHVGAESGGGRKGETVLPSNPDGAQSDLPSKAAGKAYPEEKAAAPHRNRTDLPLAALAP